MDNLKFDINEIDRFLWLSSPAFKKNPGKHEKLHAEAVLIGKKTADDYPVDPSDVMATLRRYNVNEIKYFSQNGGDRAYYMTDEKNIYLNEMFISDMARLFESLENKFFTYEKIQSALLLHELFHHIEETITQPTDALLSIKLKTFVPPVYRDISAFAYVNSLIPDMVCQFIDLYWLRHVTHR